MLGDRQHVEAVALLRRLLEEQASSLTAESIQGIDGWLKENHPEPRVYMAAVNEAAGAEPTYVYLAMTADEAEAAHHALATTINLMEQVGNIPPHAPLHGQRPTLVKVAQRLDHERRHRGRVANPNGPTS